MMTGTVGSLGKLMVPGLTHRGTLQLGSGVRDASQVEQTPWRGLWSLVRYFTTAISSCTSPGWAWYGKHPYEAALAKLTDAYLTATSTFLGWAW